MKTGMTLTQFAQELDRRHKAADDLIADTRSMHIDTLPGNNGNDIMLCVEGEGAFDVSDYAQSQLAGAMDIPVRHFRRLRDDYPDLVTAEVNAMFQRDHKRRMVRLLDGNVRAFVSDRFDRIDDYPTVSAVLEHLQDSIDLDRSRFALGAHHSHMSIVFDTDAVAEQEVRKGDVVRAGLNFRNSEVGAGSFELRPLVWRLVCTNGMVAPSTIGRRLSKRHVTGPADDDGYLTAATRSLRSDALYSEIGDICAAMADPETLAAMVERMREATAREIGAEHDVPATVERLAKTERLTEGETAGILQHLIRNGDLTQYGVANAITRYAQDVDSDDRSTELEEIGGNVIDYSPARWRRSLVLAEAA